MHVCVSDGIASGGERFAVGDDRGELQMAPLTSCGVLTPHRSALELAGAPTCYLAHYYYRFFIGLEET